MSAHRKPRLSALAAVGIAAVTLCSCASRARGGAGEPSASTTAAPPPQYEVGKLQALQTFEDGAIRLSPPSPGQGSKTTASDAFATYLKTNLYVDKVSGRTATIYAASLTSYAASDQVDAESGVLLPDTENKPVWAIEFTDVRDQATPAGQTDGASMSASPTNSLHDIVVLVDSDTGKALTLISAPPEDPPSPIPTANPGEKPSA